MTTRLELRKIGQVLVFVFLFLASMNFEAKFFYFAFAAFLVVILTQKKIQLDRISFVYLALCVLMAIYNLQEGSLTVVRCFAPFCFYVVGFNLHTEYWHFDFAPDSQLNVQRLGHKLLAVISMGSFCHYALNYLTNIGADLGRNTNDIWTGLPMAATGQNALACLMLGFATATIFLPQKGRYRLFAMISILIMFFYNLILASRTMLLALGLLMAVGLLYPKMKGKRHTIRMRSLLGMMALFLLVFMACITNFGGIQDLFRESQLFERFNGSLEQIVTEDPRMEIRRSYVSEMSDYLWGGLNMRSKYGYAHDLLLDGYDEYGVTFLFLILPILITGLRQLYKLQKFTSFGKEYKLALLLVYLSVMTEFFVEPILAGMKWLFACYCLINGSMAGMYRFYCKIEYVQMREVE